MKVSVDKDVEKFCWWECKMILWKTVWQFHKKLNIVTIRPSNSTVRYISKKNENIYPYKKCTWMLKAALFTIAKKWKPPKCLSADEWYIHTVKHYSAIKKNDIWIHITTWMNLENIILSERSQTWKTICCMIPFIQNVPNRQIHSNRK